MTFHIKINVREPVSINHRLISGLQLRGRFARRRQSRARRAAEGHPHLTARRADGVYLRQQPSLAHQVITAPARRWIFWPLGHNERERVKFNPVLLHCYCEIERRPQRGVHVRREHLQRPAIGLPRRKRRLRGRGFIENNRCAIELPARGQLGRRAFANKFNCRLFARQQIAILPTRRRGPQHYALALLHFSLPSRGRHAPVPYFFNRMTKFKLQPPIINRPARLISDRNAPRETRHPSIGGGEPHKHFTRRGRSSYARGEKEKEKPSHRGSVSYAGKMTKSQWPDSKIKMGWARGRRVVRGG